MALAHTIEDPTEAAYRRGDMLVKRAKMMESWSMYCSQASTAKVIPMKGDRAART
jgi:hypothetical protein